MKKYFNYLLIALLSFTIFTSTVSAKQEKFVTNMDDNVKLDNDVIGSSALAGNNIKADKTIEGILFTFGNNFKFNGNTEHLISFGNNIDIDGIINKDAILFGNDITIGEDSNIKRDIIIFGNNINISGKIERDIQIYASKVIIKDTTILGNITINAKEIEISKTSVDKTLKYNKDATIKIEDKNLINEIIKSKKIIEEQPTIIDKLISKLLSFVRILVVLFAMIIIMPKLFRKVKKLTNKTEIKDTLLSISEGLLTFITVPIVSLILLISNFGTPLGIISIIIYGILIYISFIITGYYLGIIIFNKLIKKDCNEFIVSSLGIFIIYILKLIPYISTITNILSILLGMGIITKLVISGISTKKISAS